MSNEHERPEKTTSGGREPSHLFVLDNSEESASKPAWFVEGECVWLFPDKGNDTSKAVAIVGAADITEALTRAADMATRATEGASVVLRWTLVRRVGTTMGEELPHGVRFFKDCARANGQTEVDVVAVGADAGAPVQHRDLTPSDRRAAQAAQLRSWGVPPSKGVH